MKKIVTRFVNGCVLCSISKPSNKKLGLYTPFHILSQPWESVSMDFVGSFTMPRKNHDYLYVIVDHSSKMCILMPCKKRVTSKKTAYLFF